MNKFLNAFFEMKNEDDLTRRAGLGAFLVIMLALALLSVSGAIASSQGDWFAWIIRIVFACLIAGAEVLDSIIFVRAVNAGSKKKAAVCFAIWIGLSWTCVQNAKEGVHFIFPDRFEKSATEIAGEAEVVGKDAQLVADARASTPAELEKVRSDIAERETFLKLMSAMTPEGIAKAQSEMISRCGYLGEVDGIRQSKTESAMRACGEQINGELATLRQRENNLLAGRGAGETAPVAGAPVTVDPRLQEVALKAKADKAWWDAFKLEVMLWVLEIAKSMGLWAAFTNVTAKDLGRARARDNEIAEAEHEARLAAIRGAAAPIAEKPEPAPAATPDSAKPIPQPEVAPPAPEPEPELILSAPVQPVAEPEPELTDAQRWGREGGKQAALNRDAEKARAAQVFVIGPVSTLDAMKVAAE